MLGASLQQQQSFSLKVRGQDSIKPHSPEHSAIPSLIAIRQKGGPAEEIKPANTQTLTDVGKTPNKVRFNLPNESIRRPTSERSDDAPAHALTQTHQQEKLQREDKETAHRRS